MQRNLSALFLLIFAVFFQTLSAQNRCGTMAHLQMEAQLDTGAAARRQQIEQFTQNYVQNHPLGNGSRAVVTIPVVFHVLYNTAAQNVSDAKCQAQINQ
jgi:hypothetical protein